MIISRGHSHKIQKIPPSGYPRAHNTQNQQNLICNSANPNNSVPTNPPNQQKPYLQFSYTHQTQNNKNSQNQKNPICNSVSFTNTHPISTKFSKPTYTIYIDSIAEMQKLFTTQIHKSQNNEINKNQQNVLYQTQILKSQKSQNPDMQIQNPQFLTPRSTKILKTQIKIGSQQ